MYGSRWIKCSDRLPTIDDADEFKNVICLTCTGEIDVVPWFIVVDFNSFCNSGNIIAWKRIYNRKPNKPRWYKYEHTCN